MALDMRLMSNLSRKSFCCYTTLFISLWGLLKTDEDLSMEMFCWKSFVFQILFFFFFSEAEGKVSFSKVE